ncbi:transcriptional regulator, TetR family [Beutenbergia cavernae DSM 12333]|uniref:Transcriptional regulator, TetR family n=1 Tax=Beutenbergia cavernae (strain ATCC BAA-8 / DSM 12333 / CCUG 43141 / JCM 11478 / NBRC 16432 / NCIMB 13614 / HKI 0122) TaxID=471853 RepID=C5BYC3_BEUC1|nr:TetR/AcrR family transcriptional regulator [Beutenbergia cavernae]ACQ81023.1 transcriptional regulator, TetR family [Beutenbergia cavernae DSM 12333]
MASREVGVLPADRRALLLATAAREFAAAGYERASLNRIIAECRMSKSSFYHYVDGKEALFDAVVDEVGRALAVDLAVPDPRGLTRGDFWERVGELVERIDRLGQQEGSYLALAQLFHLPDAPASPALVRTRAAMAAWLDGALAAGRAAGAVRDDLPPDLQARLAFAVLQAMDSWSVAHSDALGRAERERLVVAQVDALRRLLGADPA